MKNKIMTASVGLLALISLNVFAHSTAIEEPLYGIKMMQNEVEIIVKSNGCTKPIDFRLEKHNAGNHTVLNIMRVKPDRCRAMSRLIPIQLVLGNIDIAYFKINNSFVTTGRLKRLKGGGDN